MRTSPAEWNALCRTPFVDATSDSGIILARRGRRATPIGFLADVACLVGLKDGLAQAPPLFGQISARQPLTPLRGGGFPPSEYRMPPTHPK
jgi:hypothetical protein